MRSDEKKLEEMLDSDISEISIDRIRKKNAEFINLNRIFVNRSRKLKEIMDESGSEIEREL